MTKLSFSLPLTVCVYIASSGSKNLQASALATPGSRRSFLSQATTAATGATMGFLLTQSSHPGGCACGQCGSGMQHSAGCSCGSCATGAHVAGCQCGSCVTVGAHDANCACGSCTGLHDANCACGACGAGHSASCDCAQCSGGFMGMSFRPASASAFEKREIGGANRSASTAAFNIQSEKTMARLEKSGFALDTRAQEQARLSEALGSYSYPATTGKKANDKGRK